MAKYKVKKYANVVHPQHIDNELRFECIKGTEYVSSEALTVLSQHAQGF